jgi:hypothetical protein
VTATVTRNASPRDPRRPANLSSGRTWQTIIARRPRHLVSVFSRIDWTTRGTGVRLGQTATPSAWHRPCRAGCIGPTPGSLWRWAHCRSSPDSGESQAEGPAARSPKWRRMYGSACTRSTPSASRTASTGAWSQDCARGSTRSWSPHHARLHNEPDSPAVRGDLHLVHLPDVRLDVPHRHPPRIEPDHRPKDRTSNSPRHLHRPADTPDGVM